jgi:hypothetical protein
MAARRDQTASASSGTSGQSVIEFMLMLPVLLGLAMLMIRVNTVIQMGIVNQQYARAQALFVSGNGAEYPRREAIVAVLSVAKYNQFVVGISEEPDPVDADALKIDASTYRIVPNSVTGFNDAPGVEAAQRGNLRVRTSLTLCLPTLLNGGTLLRPVFPITGVTQTYAIGDTAKQFIFCSAPQVYDDDSGAAETI